MKKIILFFFFLAGFSSLPNLRAAAPDSSLKLLARELESSEPAFRLESVREIAVNHTIDGLPFLIQAAGDPDEYVRERAIQGLAATGSAKAVPPVKAALRDPDEFVRWRAVQGLAGLGVQDIIGDLAPLVKDESWRVKVCCLEYLGTIAAERLKMGSAELSRAFVDERIKPLMSQGLGDRDERVRLAAATALARVKDSASFTPLVDLLENGSMFVRDGAAMALGELSDSRAVEYLIAAVADPRNEASDEGRDWTRWGAVKALIRLTGQDFGVDSGKWKEWLAAHHNK
jgi:bilin biosynthesis protein